MATDWSKKFNALPVEIRTIGSAMEARTRIQHLNFEKERLRKRYRQSSDEIHAHIKRCKQWLERLDKEYKPKGGE